MKMEMSKMIPGKRGGVAHWSKQGQSGGKRWRRQPWRRRFHRQDPTRGYSDQSCKPACQ